MHPTAIWIKSHPLYLALPAFVAVLAFWRQPLMVALFAGWTIAALVSQVQRSRHVSEDDHGHRFE
jgi:hypothetical protein